MLLAVTNNTILSHNALKQISTIVDILHTTFRAGLHEWS